MCPLAKPSPPAEIDLYWSDEQIISFLHEYTLESRLPNNVLADSSPYQHPPSNLPEGIWYLVPPNEKKELVHGFWIANGEACKIYSNSIIVGWRKTLQYFEDQAPEGQKTDWFMQEYWITKKEICDKDKKKEESRLLCRVFCIDNFSKTETHPQNFGTVIESKNINSLASINHYTDITSGQVCESESQAKIDCEVVLSPLATDNKPNASPQAVSELECFLTGDYLELNDLSDLEDHKSPSSISCNSSCLSKLSDEAFASAFLRDLEEEEYNYKHGQQSSSRYNFTSIRPDDVVLQPAPSVTGSPLTGSVRNRVVEGPLSDSMIHGVVEGPRSDSMIHQTSTNERPLEKTAKQQNPESAVEGTSNAAPSREKKAAGSGRMKKLKTCFCFMPF